MREEIGLKVVKEIAIKKSEHTIDIALLEKIYTILQEHQYDEDQSTKVLRKVRQQIEIFISQVG